MSALPALLNGVQILPWMATNTKSLFVCTLIQERQKKKLKGPFYSMGKHSISTEFQPVNWVHRQWKWHANWTLWWINNESHWTHLCCSHNTGWDAYYITWFNFRNLLPQRNQIDWRGSVIVRLLIFSWVLSISWKMMWLAQIWNHCHC